VKFKLTAGAELDLPNQDEMRSAISGALRDWSVEAAKGPDPILWSGAGVVNMAGDLYIGGATSAEDRMGPEASLAWIVTRFNVSGLAAGETVSAYINTDSPRWSILGGISGYAEFQCPTLVLKPNQRIYVVGHGLTGGEAVYVSGAALQLPVTQLYKLL
jgi:hypothetical protein